MAGVGSYLKKHTEALVKDVGIEAACELTGKSKATLGRYYSDHDEHADRDNNLGQRLCIAGGVNGDALDNQADECRDANGKEEGKDKPRRNAPCN